MGSSTKKHKKHKSNKHDEEKPTQNQQQGLRLILKVGGQNSPEHDSEGVLPKEGLIPTEGALGEERERRHHKKSKKKKKSKDKSRDRDRDKDRDRERKHRHHHKDKKRKREEIEKVEAEEEEDEPTEEQLQQLDEVLNAIDLGSPSSSVFREPRTCVIKKYQERNLVQRMLEHVHRALEKRDPQNFFAWPVTDNIAPGYSTIISNPMDLSTMRQKVDDNEYVDLQEFMEDFKLMCENAMKYNHADTVYYKASRKLMHAGQKLMTPEKIGWLLALIPEVTNKELGFEVPPDVRAEYKIPPTSTSNYSPIKRLMPLTKFEAIPDDLEPDQILAQAKEAARMAKAKLQAKKFGGPSMGFLRQRKDGTTNLNIIVGGDGVIPGTKKRPVLLGQLTGKLTEGTGQMQGFREDRRNLAKPIKPLHYGAFGSYAPSYDSAFANLTKDETDLLLQTYGSDTAVQYAESILDFAKDCDYTVWMVDSLLDLLTGGDHSKTKQSLDDNKRLREEESAVRTALEASQLLSQATVAENGITNSSIDIDSLRSLSDLGIDVDFLDEYQEREQLQQRLDTCSQMLDRLHKVQQARLSQTLPQHLSMIAGPNDEELTLAQTVTDQLTDISKRVQPSDVAPCAGLRRAMGVAPPSNMQQPTTSITGGTSSVQHTVLTAVPPQTNQDQTNQAQKQEVEVDLESELRQFLENAPNLGQSSLDRDDKTIEEILME